MTFVPVTDDPDFHFKQSARALARGLNRMAELGQTGPLYGQYSAALKILLEPTCSPEPVLPNVPARIRY